MDTDTVIDFSSGSPRLSFREAAQFACAINDEEMRSYAAYSPDMISKYLKESCGYFDNMGLLKSDSSKVGLDCLAITHGTTHGYDAVLRVIRNRFDKFRQDQNKPELKPVIIIVLPMYGLFLEQPAELGFEIVYIKRDIRNNGILHASEVAKTLEDIRASGDRVAMAFYDSNPQNPTGLVRNSSETKILSDVFAQHNQVMREQNPEGDESSGRNLTDIHIIDDMVYAGLEHDLNNKAASFMGDSRMAGNTYVLLGTSKIGLPALRGGLVVCNEVDAKSIREQVIKNCYYPNITTMRALQYAFSASGDEAQAREVHLNKLREMNIYGELLLRSLVQGARLEQMSPPVRSRLLSDVASVVGGTDKAADLLTSGIKEIELLTQPESGFFHLAQLKDSAHVHYRQEIIRDDIALEMLFKDHGVLLATGTWCGWNKEDRLMRLSYSMEPEDIIRCAVRVKAAFNAGRS